MQKVMRTVVRVVAGACPGAGMRRTGVKEIKGTGAGAWVRVWLAGLRGIRFRVTARLTSRLREGLDESVHCAYQTATSRFVGLRPHPR